VTLPPGRARDATRPVELVPKSATIGVLLDPIFSPGADDQMQAVQAAARVLGREIRIVHASNESELDAAFADLADMRVGGLVVAGGTFVLNKRDRVLALTSRYALPTIYENREFTVAGGLISYGTSVPTVYWQIGVYTGRVLKGEKPADLPFLQPTKFDMAVNLKTAKALGLEVPTSILFCCCHGGKLPRLPSIPEPDVCLCIIDSTGALRTGEDHEEAGLICCFR
jgi:putative ABC transport system substrate-binding protein